jgi:hypothetical protein
MIDPVKPWSCRFKDLFQSTAVRRARGLEHGTGRARVAREHGTERGRGVGWVGGPARRMVG